MLKGYLTGGIQRKQWLAVEMEETLWGGNDSR